MIDNASTNGVPTQIANEFNLNYILCTKPGIAHARFAALTQLQSDEILIFVDDDNVLGNHYASFALEISNENPHWGVFGGKLLLPSDYFISNKFKHFLPYLAIKNLGNFSKESPAALQWNELEPPGAGMCVRPEVGKYIVNKIESGDVGILNVGAVHSKQFRGEDSYIARQAYFLDLNWGYHPDLTLEHRFNRDRISIRYLYQLLFNYGISDIQLNKALNTEPAYPYPNSIKELLKVLIFHLTNGRSGVPTTLRALGQFYACKF